VDGFEGREIGVLLGRFCGLRQWWTCIGLWLCLNYLRVCCGVCYLYWRWRVGDGRMSGMGLGCMWGVSVWLVVRQRVSVVIGLVFGMSVGTKVGVTMMIAMLGASGMYG
jgi:hypothetical protein